MTVGSVSVSQIPDSAQRKSHIRSQASSPMILLIPFGSSYIDNAQSDLISQCPRGDIQGVLAKHESVNYFLSLVEIRRLTL